MASETSTRALVMLTEIAGTFSRPGCDDGGMTMTNHDVGSAPTKSQGGSWNRRLRHLNPVKRVGARLRSIRHRWHDWWHSFWDDLRLYILTNVGYMPSHRIRRFIYVRFGVKLSPTAALHWRARFFCPEGVTIGDYTNVGNDAFLDGRQSLTIGSCVNIAGEVRIYTLEHDIDDPMFGAVGGPVVIEDYAYLGTRVTVLPGVRIGYGAVVASGAVVTKDVAPYMLVGGVPAKPIRERSRGLRYKLGVARRFQ